MTWRTAVLAMLLAAPSPAALLRIEMEERSDVAEGRAFGRSGAYERIAGRAWFAVDPAQPANRAIVDLDKAPRNEQGLVEFSADLLVLKPRDPATGNGAVLFDVANRGNQRRCRSSGVTASCWSRALRSCGWAGNSTCPRRIRGGCGCTPRL